MKTPVRYPFLIGMAAFGIVCTQSIGDYVYSAGDFQAKLMYLISFWVASFCLGYIIGEWAIMNNVAYKMRESMGSLGYRHDSNCTKCGKRIGDFEDESSHTIFHLSGMCQDCQNIYAIPKI